MSILALITAFLQSVTEFLRWRVAEISNAQRNEIDLLDDEIIRLAAIGDPASKLRITTLLARRERKLSLRSGDSDPNPKRPLPVQGGDSNRTGTEIP